MSIFTKVLQKRPKRSNFDLSHENKLSTEFGRLTPILCQEVLPSDRWIGKTEVFCRMAPMIAPIMHRVDVYVHYFFCPNRILWKDWEAFITGASTDRSSMVMALAPFISTFYNYYKNHKLLSYGSLADYLGVPVLDESIFGNSEFEPGSEIALNSLPFRAYQLIYNEFYRDENLCPEVDILFDKGGSSNENIDELMKIRYRAWEKDYFTSALPWPQKGLEAMVPLSGSVSIEPDTTKAVRTVLRRVSDNSEVQVSETSPITYTDNDKLIVDNQEVYIDTAPLTGDISGNSQTTINDLRRQIRLQEFLEKDARGGTRLFEILRSHFGVRTEDSRLQRPEYLGGGKTNIVISEVLQQSQSTTNSNLGEMAGHGVAANVTNKFKRTFNEHGWVIGILSIMPRTSYQQGLHKQFTRKERTDYAWPEFSQIGEQPIENGELFFDYKKLDSNHNTFGYAPRYSEYKYINSSVHGDIANRLDFWHLGRKFISCPGLNEDFITCQSKKLSADNPFGMNRIFAYTNIDYDHFWLQIYNKLIVKRPLPYYGTPLL